MIIGMVSAQDILQVMVHLIQVRKVFNILKQYLEMKYCLPCLICSPRHLSENHFILLLTNRMQYAFYGKSLCFRLLGIDRATSKNAIQTTQTVASRSVASGTRGGIGSLAHTRGRAGSARANLRRQAAECHGDGHSAGRL